jgi:8-oxo-dGTP pyrophosphatase MutT (NUDIX family)
MAIKSWSKLKSKIAGEYRVFRLREDISRSPRTGREHTFYVLDSPDWINVIPITPEGLVVLIRQYRHGTEEITLEVPGGMVDPADGSPKESAARELLEETGYAAQQISHIGTVTPNPAILNNFCYTFLAHDVRVVAEPHFDGSEDIEVELFDLKSVQELIAAGQITHALTIAAFYYYEHV